MQCVRTLPKDSQPTPTHHIKERQCANPQEEADKTRTFIAFFSVPSQNGVDGLRYGVHPLVLVLLAQLLLAAVPGPEPDVPLQRLLTVLRAEQFCLWNLLENQILFKMISKTSENHQQLSHKIGQRKLQSWGCDIYV